MKSPLGLEARIPVFELFKDALFLLWAKRARLFSMFLPIIVVLVVLDRYVGELVQTLVEKTGSDVVGEFGGLPTEFLVLNLISFLLSILLATTVHRFTLQEQSQWPKNALRIPTSSDLRYLIRIIQVIVITALSGSMVLSLLFILFPSLAAAVESGAVNGMASMGVASFGFIIVVLAMFYLGARLSVTLPELAIGTTGSSLVRSWRMSSGNGWRIVNVVLILPFIVSYPFFHFLEAESLVTTILASFGVYFMTIISTTVLSLSYQFLVEFYEPEEGENIVPEADPEDDNSLDA
jgi:hypothetical protein